MKAKRKAPRTWADVAAHVHGDVLTELRHMAKHAADEASWFGDKGRWSPEEQASCREAVAHWKRLRVDYNDAITVLRAARRKKAGTR